MKVYVLCRGDYCACEEGVVVEKVLISEEELKKELEKMSKEKNYIKVQVWERGRKIEEKFIKFKDF